MRILFLWDWLDFGLVLRIYKNTSFSDYRMSLDIQLGWLNIWITLLRKGNN